MKVLHPMPRPSIRTSLYVCAQCTFRANNASRYIPKVSRRGIGTKFIAKVAAAKEEWRKQASLIRSGEKQSMMSILEERGYIHQVAGKTDELKNLLIDKRVGAYVGIDPTAPSLHIGHMVPLMSLFWMHVHGYHTVTLLGGATAKIGDPTGRTQDREKVHSSERTENMVKMHYQLKKLWLNVEKYGRRHGFIWEWAWKRGLVNNNAWMNKLSVIEMLQIIGPSMRMGTMLSRDTAKTKLNSPDGMSFAEFTYPILQAWDWWHMYNTMKIQVQIGGSDQFGNIVAGIEAINYIRTNHPDPDVRDEFKPLLNLTVQDEFKPKDLNAPIGFTTPLLTNSNSEKLGKSAGNALWLDGDMTSPFALYGYWLRQPDADVERYLKFFTFLPMETIRTAVKEHMEDPKKRKGQHLLAREFVELVHGEQVAIKAEAEHRAMFSNPPLDPKSLAKVYDEIDTHYPNTKSLNTWSPSPTPTVQLPKSIIATKSIGQIIHAAGLASSRSDGHRLAQSGGVYIGGLANHKNKQPMDEGAISWTKVQPWENEETASFIVNDILILRKGKSNIRVIKLLSDEEWEKSGETYPGDGKQAKSGSMRNNINGEVAEMNEPNIIHGFEKGKQERRGKQHILSGFAENEETTSKIWGRKKKLLEKRSNKEAREVMSEAERQATKDFELRWGTKTVYEQQSSHGSKPKVVAKVEDAQISGTKTRMVGWKSLG